MEFNLVFTLFLLLLAHPSDGGWLSSNKKSVLKLKSETFNANPSFGFDPTRVTQLSWHPRAFLYKGFLSHDECQHLIQLAKDKLEKSMVADNDSGKSIPSEVRTSSGMFLQKAQDDVVSLIEARIAAWTFLPQENGEPMQVLRYELGEKYEPHFDYFHDKVNQQLGGHRIATVLMYLSDVEKGGETIFPNSEAKLQQPKDESWSDCAKGGYAVKPRKGDALLFFSLHPDATTDKDSLHGSCPVIEGEKWSATKWIHVRSFEKSFQEDTSSSGECVDNNVFCSQWAKSGECKKNPLYMVGSNKTKGHCRKSCNTFEISCVPLCISSNAEIVVGVAGHIVPIVVRNKCPFTVWPATAPNTGHPVIANGGFCLQPDESTLIHAPSDWSGRIWARTGCKFRAEDSDLKPTWAPACQTGDCDGRLECNGLIGTPPATLVELTLHTDKNQPSFYDVSLVDGYNLPVSVIAGRSRNCAIRGCSRDVKETCPLELQIKDVQGTVVACKSACLAFNLDRFCCRNEYGNPEKCKPSLYSNLFKKACPSYVSYAFDSPSPLVSCVVRELDITFCPSGWGDNLEQHTSTWSLKRVSTVGVTLA